MAVPVKVLDLIERFDRNLEAYKQGRYKEAEVRHEFIAPFFKALGWDVDNEQGFAEAYKDVVHEASLRVGRAVKAPDYCFRIGGVRKFFVEAKKPSVDIRGDVHPAYQLRRYAWSAKLPLSILTDFEEFAVYDCRIKPAKSDKPATARTIYLTYTDYPARWDEIAGIFSREAILKGSFDKYVESHKAKRGTAEVDAAFLQEIERWRGLLARNIALRNPRLSQRELNFAVQRTIDRIIFLRICEDRGIEPYGQLMALQNGTDVYQRLLYLFRQADDRYNAGLFHFEPEKGRPADSLDALTPGLTIDDKVLKEIFKNLYYPDSPYEFSVLPADILGQVYEQFLGKVIRLTPAHRAVVEDKPEVKKAGGVYYTPTYIVDYIVKQTVGQLVEGKKAGPRGGVSKLRILDPACGSGSFLLGAYQFLLDWHRDQYIADDPYKWATRRTPRLYQTAAGDWQLTTAERKRILLNNIYGVDIDPQAVEVTKLSLLLKVLEGETEESLSTQLSFLRERALPDLEHNIKCGNSLIGTDFYDGRQMSLLDEEEMYRLNIFDCSNRPQLRDTIRYLAPVPMEDFRTIRSGKDLRELVDQRAVDLPVLGLVPDGWSLSKPGSQRVLERIKQDAVTLHEYVDGKMFRGVVTGRNRVFVINQATRDRLISEDPGSAEIIKPVLAGRDIRRYTITFRDRYLVFTRRGINIGRFPSILNYLEQYRQDLTPKKTGKERYGRKPGKYEWYEIQDTIDYHAEFEKPKIIYPDIATTCRFTLDRDGYFGTNTTYFIPGDDLYLLGILNSKLGLFYFSEVCAGLEGRGTTYLRFFGQYLGGFPVRTIAFDNPADKALHDQIVALVERMLELHRQLAEAKLPQARTVLQRQIDATGRQIDKLVYELYDLTEEEIKIVEEGVG